MDGWMDMITSRKGLEEDRKNALGDRFSSSFLFSLSNTYIARIHITRYVRTHACMHAPEKEKEKPKRKRRRVEETK